MTAEPLAINSAARRFVPTRTWEAEGHGEYRKLFAAAATKEGAE